MTRIALVVGIAALSGLGCKNIHLFKENQQWEGPRIFSIGRQATLSFDPERPLEIPIEGKGLKDTFRYRIGLTISGTYPLTVDDYVVDKSILRTNWDVLNVVINTNYLKRVKTGDVLDLAVHVQQYNPAETALAEVERALIKTTPNMEDIGRVGASINYLDHTVQELERKAGGAREKTAMITSISNAISVVKLNLASLTESFSNYVEAQQQFDAYSQQVQAETMAARSHLTELSNSFHAVSSTFKEVSNEDLAEYIQAIRNQSAQFEISRLPNRLPSSNGINRSFKGEGASFQEFVNAQRAYESAKANFERAVGNEDQARQKKQRFENEFAAKKSEIIQNLQPALLAMSDGLHPGVNKHRNVATASRLFTFYQVTEFRDKYHAKRILPENIMVSPEPEDEARKLFGPRIAADYFVVRLSVRNTDDEDRLVSTGMIRARGRAMVEPKEGSQGDGERFTVPVEVAPHSAQQVYSILTDGAPKRLRALTFRSLELAGAIASAYALSFDATTRVKDAIQLSTGVGIPAFSKWWTDDLPGFQRNVVNFAMDDLVKVPKGGVTSHKFLFFPKDAIEGIIIDQHSYGDYKKFNPKSGVIRRGFEQPNAHIAYLIFDNLEIPFENVFQPEPSDQRQRVLELEVGLASQIDWRETMGRAWGDTNRTAIFAGSLRKDLFASANTNSPYNRLQRLWGPWKTVVPSSTNETALYKGITNTLSTLEKLESLLNPTNAATSKLLLEVIPKLKSDLEDIKVIRSELVSGKPFNRFERRIQEIEESHEKSRLAEMFYRVAAEMLADDALMKNLEAGLKPPLSDNGAKATYENLKRRIEILQATGGKIVSEMIPSAIKLP